MKGKPAVGSNAAKKPSAKADRPATEKSVMTHKELTEWLRYEDRRLQVAENNGRRWLLKEEENFTAPDAQAGAGGQPPAASNPPGTPGAGAGGPPDADGGNKPKDAGDKKADDEPDDISKDPQAPDMPDSKDPEDFERWKNNFLKESIKGDAQKLIDMIHDVRDLDLDSYPRKFVEDNLQVQFLRQNANVEKASKEIRKSIREQLDQNNPSVSVVNHLFMSLQQQPDLGNIFIKLEGLHGMKGDLHRKYIAALLGGVQVGSGGNNEDVIFNDKEYSIRLSTRMNARWGMIDIGRWALKEDDPERYLSEPELKKLDDGTPEEKDVLRRRVVMESIADYFRKRAFVANVVNKDGTVYMLGWDLSNSLRSAYTDGKLVIKTTAAENSEAMIDDEGSIIPFVEMKIMYERETGRLDEDGKPEKEQHEFMVRRDGMLFLTAQYQILKEAASSFQGIVLKEIPYKGNPSDLKTLTRCIPSADEILTRKC
jgi:hypothetical protein